MFLILSIIFLFGDNTLMYHHNQLIFKEKYYSAAQ
jgi:hypothetical protein